MTMAPLNLYTIGGSALPSAIIMLHKLFNSAEKRSERPRPRVPSDRRVYAIGDIHGCDTEFAKLLDLIDADHAARSPKEQTIVLLGDLVDRGPDSAAVVERARQLCASRAHVRMLAGNHEELLLGACAGDEQSLRIFARNGGRETAISYGVRPDTYDAADFGELHRLLEHAVPTDHRSFIKQAEDMIVIGDYAFVHAGIRPGVPLERQRRADLRWIRHRFLDDRQMHEKYIVHGHTISETVDEQANRLGIDTGAYATGKLTAVALEGDRRWFLQT